MSEGADVVQKMFSAEQVKYYRPVNDSDFAFPDGIYYAYAEALLAYGQYLQKPDEDQTVEKKKNLEKALIENLEALREAYQAADLEKYNAIFNSDSTNIPRAADDGMRTVFLVNGVFLVLAPFLPPVLAVVILSQAMACTWNFFDSEAGFAGIKHSAEKNNEHDKFWDKAQWVSATLLKQATVINTAYLIIELLSKTALPLASTVLAHLPAALGMLNGPFFAGAMGVCALYEGHNAIRARLKSSNPDYFVKTCEEAISGECQNLLPRKTWLQQVMNKPATIPTLEGCVKAAVRIGQLQKDKAALECYSRYTKVGVYIFLEEEGMPTTPEDFISDPDRRNKVLYARLLMDRQAEKAKEHRLKACVWGAAFIVMAAACVSFPPVGVLVVASMILTVGLAKFGQVLTERISEDYSHKAVEAALGGNRVKEDELLTEALQPKVANMKKRLKGFSQDGEDNVHHQNDIKAIKTYLSEEHKRELISEVAKKQYTPKRYLECKATQFGSFFSNKANYLANQVLGGIFFQP